MSDSPTSQAVTPTEPPAKDALQELWTLIAEATRDSAKWARLGTVASAKVLEVSNAAAIAAKERLADRIASLSSQLANERFEHQVTLDNCEDLIVQRADLAAQLERLKAEQLTAEEAKALLDGMLEEDLADQAAYEAHTRGFKKLRQISYGSDTGAHP